mmetsp:Transcript_16751/g.25315  ORF Transcript_16751/g.25315 Transcript_16751/m.25315 type:complete len:180 (-) Transcript_16751:69-608(-)
MNKKRTLASSRSQCSTLSQHVNHESSFLTQSTALPEELQLIQLKLKLAQEKEGLDYLQQEVLKETLKLDDLQRRVDQQAETNRLCLQVMDLSYLCDDLNESIGIFDLDAEMTRDEKWKLEQEIIVEHKKERRKNTISMSSPMNQRRSSRSLRHQKRRNAAAYSPAHRSCSLQPIISRAI